MSTIGIKKEDQPQLDPKTKAVFDKKGYIVIKRIAEGAFGKVYTSKNLRKGEMAAVKVMDLDKCSERFKEKFLPRELSMLIQIRHKYVVNTFDIFKSNRKIYIFMEFCPNGTIADAVKKLGPLSEEKARFWFVQCVEGLRYMHKELGVCHRDIKVENVLLDKDDNAKLSDFGFSKEVVVNGEVVLSSTYCGTEPYYCPELVKKRDNKKSILKYDPLKADSYAMGVMLFAMLNNKFPYHWDERMAKEQQNYEYKYRDVVENKLSSSVKDLIRKLLENDTGKRYDMDQTAAHPWMKGQK